MYSNIPFKPHLVCYSGKVPECFVWYYGNAPAFEPAHVKRYNLACATSIDLDQPAHPRSLIRVYTGYLVVSKTV